MDPVRALLNGVLAPALVAGLLVLVLRRGWRTAAPAPAPWATGLALAAGYGVAFALVLGWPALPPVDVTHATPWLALVAAALGALPRRGTRRDGLASPPPGPLRVGQAGLSGILRGVRGAAPGYRSGPYGLRGSLRPTSSTSGTSCDLRVPPCRFALVRGLAVAALGLLSGAFLVSPLIGRSLGAGLATLDVVLVGATFVALDQGLSRALAGLDPRGGALAVIVLVSGAAAATLLSDVASLAQVTGGLAAALGAVFALGLWRPAAATLGAATPVIAAVVASTLWGAVLYANGRYEVVALIVAAPLLLWALRRALARPRPLLVALALPALVTLVPVGAAAGLAARAYFADTSAETEAAPAAAPGAAAPGSTAPAAAPAAEGYDPNYGY